MSCNQFTTSNPACKTFTFIEPDDTVLSATSSGGVDQSLDERGDTLIPFPLSGPAQMIVQFATPKASLNYRFEYLYIDALGIVLPGAIQPVVNSFDQFGFTVELAGIPLSDGYVLRWRVVVTSIIGGIVIDAPENLYLQIPAGVRTFTATFINPRSNTTYGFSELRIENLADPVSSQRFIQPQVAIKTMGNFTVGLNAPTDTQNYFLVARTP